MTKGTKAFRIIISILLALTMLISAFCVFVFFMDYSREAYGIYVAGVSVTKDNEDDVLGDGTVCYDPYNNILTFNNATIEYEYNVVYSSIDLTINLIGENKFVSTSEVYSIGIYAGDDTLAKDLSISGDGSLTIEMPNKAMESVGIFASELIIGSDVKITTPDCEKQVNGIVCASSLLIVGKAEVNVNSGASNYCSAVRVRGNAFLEEGTALNISVKSGTTETCKGLTVSGDLFLGKDTKVDVSIDDGGANQGQCIRVSGLMEIGAGSTVKASAKSTYAIECLGTIEANKDAVISAASEKKDHDIFCSGAMLNYGASVDGEIEALGGIHNRD